MKDQSMKHNPGVPVFPVSRALIEFGRFCFADINGLRLLESDVRRHYNFFWRFNINVNAVPTEPGARLADRSTALSSVPY